MDWTTDSFNLFHTNVATVLHSILKLPQRTNQNEPRASEMKLNPKDPKFQRFNPNLTEKSSTTMFYYEDHSGLWLTSVAWSFYN